MLIQVDDFLYNQNKIWCITIKESFVDKGYSGCYLYIWTEKGDYNEFEILSLRNKSVEEQYEAKKTLQSFLGQFFGKIGIKLTLNDPNKIGMDIYD